MTRETQPRTPLGSPGGNGTTGSCRSLRDLRPPLVQLSERFVVNLKDSRQDIRPCHHFCSLDRRRLRGSARTPPPPHPPPLPPPPPSRRLPRMVTREIPGICSRLPRNSRLSIGPRLCRLFIIHLEHVSSSPGRIYMSLFLVKRSVDLGLHLGLKRSPIQIPRVLMGTSFGISPRWESMKPRPSRCW